jgi:hypothetical protein
MTASRDTERLIRAFLDEGVTELPERVYDAVRSDLDRTHQRVVIGPWRTPDMNTFAKFAMAASAVLVVALVGYNLLPSDSPRGGTASASPSPSVAASPSPSPSPSASTSDLAFFPPGPITPGTYSIVLSGKRFSVDMPGSGWSSNGSFRIATGSGQGAFIFWTDAPTNVYGDPCAKVPLEPPAGETPADLAAAISRIPGTDLVDGPSDVTVGGHPAALVSIRIREDIGCAPNEFMLWYDEDPSIGRWPDALGDTINTWIIDVDGTNVWIDASAGRSTSPALQAEQRQIIESIRFE